MKKKDVLILSFLRSNARAPLTQLSRRTGLPVSTIFDRIKGCTGSFVKKHCALLDFQKIGFSTCAHILFKVDKEHRDSLILHLNKSRFVNSFFKINNGWDFLVECIFKDMRSLEGFVEILESDFGITGKEVHYILDEYKRECFMDNPDFAESLFKATA